MPVLSQHVCFSCRKVFKKPHEYAFLKKDEEPFQRTVHLCPECKRPMAYMGYKFRAPPKANIKEWKRIEEGVKLGAEWQIRTKRKEEPQPKLSHALKKTLGISKSLSKKTR